MSTMALPKAVPEKNVVNNNDYSIFITSWKDGGLIICILYIL